MLRVHSYESMGTVDGPGLRFVIFLQGCNFRCLYCANPDTIEMGKGMEVSAEEIFEKVDSVRSFFGKRGGVTFSGGEPLLQASELIPLFEKFRSAGIHTCIDTNGGVWNSKVEQLLQLTDLVLLDVKQIDDSKHTLLTSRSNKHTLNLATWLETHNKPFWLRYVLVPTVSDATEDIERLGERFAEYKMVERVEILPYHKLGIHKYEALGLKYELLHVNNNTPEELERVELLMTKYFKNVSIG
ncbi:MAG: pyruvate formate-lyase-activating protein, partial [Rikenellaceae bacterium]